MGFPLTYSDATCCENDSTAENRPANHDNRKPLRVIKVHVNPRILHMYASHACVFNL